MNKEMGVWCMSDIVKLVEQNIKNTGKQFDKVSSYQWKDYVVIVRSEQESLTRLAHGYQLNEIIQVFEKNQDKKDGLMIYKLCNVVYSNNILG